MEVLNLLLLLGAGLTAGYIAGLIGVGGGIIFAPVLFLYFERLGISPDVIAPLTIGTSLLCTLVAAAASAWFQLRRQVVDTRVALRVGLFSAAAIFLMTRFVTTQPWYDGTVFQMVFAVLLLVAVARMVWRRDAVAHPPGRHGHGVLAGTGTVAGAVAAAAGVGGGVVLVPAYHNLLGLPMHRAVGTSSATIVLITLVGIAHYAAYGHGAATPAGTLGYVDTLHAFVLAVPAALSARLGVWTAHRVDTRLLRWAFALVASFVALRLLLGTA